jgi:hypothetical protein
LFPQSTSAKSSILYSWLSWGSRSVLLPSLQCVWTPLIVPVSISQVPESVSRPYAFCILLTLPRGQLAQATML